MALPSHKIQVAVKLRTTDSIIPDLEDADGIAV